jgi:hypothetical protein
MKRSAYVLLAVTLAVTALLCGGLTAQTKFFPDRAFCITNLSQENCDRWYPPYLTAMKESSLWERSKDSETESYRFLWLRSFHHPVSLRLDVASDGSGVLAVKVLSGQGGYDPGKLIENREVRIEKLRVKRFLELLGAARFWDLPSEEKDPNEVVVDGAQWIIEGTGGGHYHVVDRISPPRGPYRDAALFLMRLGGLKVPSKEMY